MHQSSHQQRISKSIVVTNEYSVYGTTLNEGIPCDTLTDKIHPKPYSVQCAAVNFQPYVSAGHSVVRKSDESNHTEPPTGLLCIELVSPDSLNRTSGNDCSVQSAWFPSHTKHKVTTRTSKTYGTAKT